MAGYKAPVQVEREWEEEYGEVTAVYCDVSPKYPSTLMTMKGGKRKEVGLKDIVDITASTGYDLAFTAILKSKISECSENGRFSYTRNCVIEKAVIVGLASKHTA
jgi:hypothetical protein